MESDEFDQFRQPIEAPVEYLVEARSGTHVIYSSGCIFAST